MRLGAVHEVPLARWQAVKPTFRHLAMVYASCRVVRKEVLTLHDTEIIHLHDSLLCNVPLRGLEPPTF